MFFSTVVSMNKTVLITGGSSGIGRSIAQGLHEQGHTVYILSRRHPSDWEKPMPSSWNTSQWIQTDFSDRSQMKTVLRDRLKEIKAIDALIHCAVTYGSTGRHTFETTPISEWDELFTVNTHAPFIITQAVLPYLKKKAFVIGFASSVTFAPGPGRIGYAASKLALHGMLVGLAAEKADTDICVAEILPQHIVRTPGIEKRRPQGYSFENYTSPDVFIKPISLLLKSEGDEYNGKCLAVSREGEIKIFDTLTDTAPTF